MAFVKAKNIGEETYYYYVESFRVGDKVKQKNLKYLGKEKPTQKQLDELKQEFSEKKIQQVIRSEYKYQPYKVDSSFLEKVEKLKEDFFIKLNNLNPKSKEQLISRFKTGYTYHSCSIEGNTLSRAQVDLVLNKHQSVEGKRLLEIQEVRNHEKAIEYMMSELGDLTEDFIKRLHEVLSYDITELQANDPEFVESGYRIDMRFIEGADFVPVPPLQIPHEMKDLVRFYKQNKYKIHPIELASEFHLRFAIIHPFSDGNGRMARLLMNFILERSGFPLIDISVKNREEYLNALASKNSAKLTKFIYSELKNYAQELFVDLKDEKLDKWFNE